MSTKTLISFISSLLLLCAVSSYAQKKSNPAKVNLGLKAGLNFSQIDGKYWENGYKTNLLGGAFLRLHNRWIGVQIEGLFSQVSYTTGKDFKNIYGAYVDSGKTALDQGKLKVSYFNIPFMFQFKFLPRTWVQLGAQYSGVVSVEDENKFFKDAKSLINDGQLSALAGLWFDLPANINAGVRYVSELSRTDNNNINEIWKQRTIQAHIGIAF